jgi:hypothetical protein
MCTVFPVYPSSIAAADERIRAALSALAERDHLIRVVATLGEDVAAEEQRVAELSTALHKEQTDVARYERGVWALLYRVFADHEARLSKEQREAAEAEARLCEALASRDALSAQVASVATRLASFAGADAELALAREAKHALLLSLGSPAAAELDGIIAQLGAADAELRALDEAIAAGLRAHATLEQLAEALGSARNWGKADLVIGSALISWAKRAKLDTAHGLAGAVQAELIAFQRELGDVGLSLEAQVAGPATHGRFLDIWFDNLFTDLRIQDGIIDAQRSTDDTLLEVRVRVGQVQQRRAQLAARIAALLESRDRLLDPGA